MEQTYGEWIRSNPPLPTKQTAVEWLAEQLFKDTAPTLRQRALIEEARAMHKEQIENAWDRGQYIGENFPQRIIEPECENDSEHYYDKTYGKE
jgi:hypothetical protein